MSDLEWGYGTEWGVAAAIAPYYQLHRQINAKRHPSQRIGPWVYAPDFDDEEESDPQVDTNDTTDPKAPWPGVVLPPDLAERLKAIVKAAGTYQEVADQFGISRSFLAKIVNGRRAPTGPLIDKMDSVLDLPVDLFRELHTHAVPDRECRDVGERSWLPRELAERLQEEATMLMEAQGLGFRTLAARMTGVSAGHLWRVINRGAAPRYWVVVQLSGVLGIDGHLTVELFKHTPPEPPYHPHRHRREGKRHGPKPKSF